MATTSDGRKEHGSMEQADLAHRVADALMHDPRLIVQGGQIVVAEEPAGSGAIVFSGSVERLSGKKIASLVAERIRGVRRVDNRLLVEPVQTRRDTDLREAVAHVLIQDPYLTGQPWQVEVHDGVVVLAGRVPTEVRRRLAGVLAWWVPGVRDVVNQLAVEEQPEDDDAEIVEACRAAIEKDPLVDESEVLIRSRDRVVRLIGTVEDDAVREAAEDDCWAVLGVRDVANELTVATPEG